MPQHQNLRMRYVLRSALLVLALPLFAAGLSQKDVDQVKHRMNDYVTAWLKGDPAAIMQNLTDDSILIAGAKAPHVGADAIRKYWWPAGSPPTVLTRFDNTVDGITGSGDTAVVRGTQVIEWTSGQERWRTAGNYMTVLRRTKDGWKIVTQMAANTPAERL